MPAPNFNITTTTTPTSGPTSAPNATPTNAGMVTRTVTRSLPPPTVYNPDTGAVEERGSWTGAPVAEPSKATEAAPAETPSPTAADRRKAFLDARTAERQAKQAKRAEAQAKAQELAAQHLKAGDYAAAAKALGMPLDQLAQGFSAAFMGQTQKPAKELTPAEKHEAELRGYKDQLEAQSREFKQFQGAVARDTYIRNSIAPVLADKEAFEFIHAQGLENVQSYIYDYANREYAQTGVEPSIRDIAEAVEAQLAEQDKAAHDRYRNSKRGKAALGARPEDQADSRSAAPALGSDAAEREEGPAADLGPNFSDPRLEHRRPADLSSRMPLAARETPTAAPAARRLEASAAPKLPFALLGKAERLRQMEEERRRDGA